MTRGIRRGEVDDGASDELEQEGTEVEVTEVEVTEEPERVEHEKIHAAAEAAQDSEFQSLFALGDAIREERGDLGPAGANNKSADYFKRLSAWLADRGLDFSANALEAVYYTACKMNALRRLNAEEAGLPFWTLNLMRDHLELLDDMLACRDGKRPSSLNGLMTRYRGEEVPMISAFRKGKRITQSDCHIVLGHKRQASSALSTNPALAVRPG
jgi:hypothetical protein